MALTEFASSLLFLAALPAVFILPGWAVLFILRKHLPDLTRLETLLLAAPVSIVFVNTLVIGLDRLHVPLRPGILAPLLGLVILAGLGLWVRERGAFKKTRLPLAFLAIFAAMLVIKLVYLFPITVPSATDLGHHMYWVKKIVLEAQLPEYAEADIVTGPDGRYAISDPEPISDFIIGEHITLALLQMFSGIGFTSAYSLLALLFIHIATAVLFYALARRLFEWHPQKEGIALLSFALVALLYSFMPPQMKYIEGGVMGNNLSNLIIPGIFLFLILAVRTWKTPYLIFALFLAVGLAHTHHLSTFLFAIAFGALTLLLALFNRPLLKDIVIRLVCKRSTLIALAVGLLWLFVLVPPAYITNAAVGTVIGTPEAQEHQGFALSQFKFAIGEPRFVFGALGLILLFALPRMRKRDTALLLAAWTLPWSLIVLYPAALGISLPSGRVANYLIFPFALLAAFALSLILEKLKTEQRLRGGVRIFGALLIVVFVLHDGFYNNNAYFESQREDSNARMLSLFQGARHLESILPDDAVAMHDHINMLGTSWIKTFFMRDYNFPFYRAHLFRYDRATDRQEKCTLYVISSPNTGEAQRCLDELGVKAVFVNESIDGEQFTQFDTFWQVYSDAYYSIYWYAPQMQSNP